MTIQETIDRARKHYEQLPPHVKERETAKHLRELLLIVSFSMSTEVDTKKKASDTLS